MLQSVAFYFVNDITLTFTLITITIYTLFKYILLVLDWFLWILFIISLNIASYTLGFINIIYIKLNNEELSKYIFLLFRYLFDFLFYSTQSEKILVIEDLILTKYLKVRPSFSNIIGLFFLTICIKLGGVDCVLLSIDLSNFLPDILVLISFILLGLEILLFIILNQKKINPILYEYIVLALSFCLFILAAFLISKLYELFKALLKVTIQWLFNLLTDGKEPSKKPRKPLPSGRPTNPSGPSGSGGRGNTGGGGRKPDPDPEKEQLRKDAANDKRRKRRAKNKIEEVNKIEDPKLKEQQLKIVKAQIKHNQEIYAKREKAKAEKAKAKKENAKK